MWLGVDARPSLVTLGPIPHSGLFGSWTFSPDSSPVSWLLLGCGHWGHRQENWRKMQGRGQGISPPLSLSLYHEHISARSSTYSPRQ